MLLFYILWGTALVRLFFSPVFKMSKMVAFFCCILVGLWLIGGVGIYSAARARYETQKESLEVRRLAVEEKQRLLQSLARVHPTARDVQQALYVISYQLGDTDAMQKALQSLRIIDPNHPEILSLQRQQLE